MRLLVNSEPTDSLAIKYKDKVQVEITYKLDKTTSSYYLGYSLFDEQERRLWRIDKAGGKKGENQVILDVDSSVLKPGQYHLAADAFIENSKWVIHPKATNATVSFTLADQRPDIVNEKIEGIIKPLPARISKK